MTDLLIRRKSYKRMGSKVREVWLLLRKGIGHDTKRLLWFAPLLDDFAVFDGAPGGLEDARIFAYDNIVDINFSSPEHFLSPD